MNQYFILAELDDGFYLTCRKCNWETVSPDKGQVFSDYAWHQCVEPAE